MKRLKGSGLLPSAGVGSLCAAALTAILCLPLAAAVNGRLLPLSASELAAALAAGLAVLIATVFISRARCRQALVSGTLIACGLTLIAALGCALAGEGAAFGTWLPRLGAVALCGGLLGALLSLGGKRRTTRRRK